ncbi:MAG: helix-turn-helix domain-containing protein [Caldilineaceae bacterium]|nr:helix-turn-helix domain-containing protein [Caldilineaceae bacterium]
MFESNETEVVSSRNEPLATLFLAESNPEDLRTLASALTTVGYNVIKLIDGQQVLSLVDTFVPDLILVDSQLAYSLQTPSSTTESSAVWGTAMRQEPMSPHQSQANVLFDGFALCRMLSQEVNAMQIPIILLGVSDSSEARLKSLQANAWHYVVKPPAIAELHLQIQNILNRTKGNRLLQEQSRRFEERAARHEEELQTERAKRRRSEERISRLMETIQVQNQQLQLLTAMTLQHPSVSGNGPAPERHPYREQVAILQNYLDQLTSLVLSLQEDLNPQTVSLLKAQLDANRRAAVDPGGEPSSYGHGQKHRSQQQLSRSLRDDHCQPVLLKQLSAREYDIFLHLVEGYSYHEIAEMFQISSSTVRSYRSRIMQKLGISNSTEMIKLAVRHGLITLR